MAITELWRNQTRYQKRNKEFIVSEPKTILKGPKKGELRYPEDKAAGVGLLLSDRIAKKVRSFGSEGERICWARIKGPVCHLFVIAIYLPHRGRTSPSQDDTLADLRKVLATVPTHDCLCILGDLNEQVEAEVQGHTGKWTAGPASRNAGKITELMRLNQLVAVNTLFRPKKNKSVCTFLQTETADNKQGNAQANDYGKYVGQKVKAKYKGKWVAGVVEHAYTNKKGRMRWALRFDDGHVMQCTEKLLKDLLVYVRKKQVGRQLDYVLVSKRWVSCVEDCKVCWGPAIHRDLHGHKNDHALLACRWKWRVRTHKPTLAKDFSLLTKNTKSATEIKCKFDAAVAAKLAELKHEDSDPTHKIYSDMCTAICHAVDAILPNMFPDVAA